MSRGTIARLKFLARASLMQSKAHEKLMLLYQSKMFTYFTICMIALVVGIVWIFLDFVKTGLSLVFVSGFFLWCYVQTAKRARKEQDFLKLYITLCQFITSALLQRNWSPFVLSQALKGYNFLEDRKLTQDILVNNDEPSLQPRTTNHG